MERECPYTYGEDDGTVKQCVERGHCGCDEKEGVMELKPCPFCGKEPRVTHRAASDEGLHAGGYVAFIACFCGTYSAKAHQPGGGNTVAEAIQHAGERWNTRARADMADELAARLESNQELLAAMLHERRPESEIEQEMLDNREALNNVDALKEGE